MTESHPQLLELRQRMALIEGRADTTPAARFATGHAGIDAALDGGLARGALHEICADGEDDASAASAFAALLAMQAGGRAATVMWLRTDAATRRSGYLYAPGLVDLGIDPATLVLGLPADDVALLRSAADSVRCAGLGAVVVECWGNPRALDLTASRRLVLAAEASGVTLLMLRIEARAGPTAAATRWRVASAPSIALEAEAPGHPMFDVELLRRRGGPAGQAWRMEWSRDDASFRETLSGAVVPLATDGAAAAGEPRRRAG